MAEGLLKHYGKGKFKAFSAGSNPAGNVHPTSLKILKSKGIDTEGFYSKSWDGLEKQQIDIVITVCDNAAGESCPVFLGKAMKTHWGVEDPAHFKGSSVEVESEFKCVCEKLEGRIKALCELDVGYFSKDGLQQKLNEIGTYE